MRPRRGWGAVALLAAAPLTAQAPVFVELHADPPGAVVGQAITLRVRVGIEATFQRESLVPLFRQRLDWPVQVVAPWWQELAGALPLRDAAAISGPSCVLNEALARGVTVPAVTRDGKQFAILELRRRVAATAAGELAVPGVTVRYAYATQFSDHFLEGRVPTDRREAEASAASLRVAVAALPADAPADFAGAVGEFTVTAQAAPLAVAVGETIKLTLRVRGEGNLDGLRAPRLDALDGLRVLGMVEERAVDERRLVYDVVLRTALVALPAITFTYFAPGAAGQPGAWRTARTEPIALAVRGAPTAEAAPPGLPTAALKSPSSGGARPYGAAPLAVGLALPWLWAGALWGRRRAQARRAADPLGTRARNAAAAFQTAIGQPGHDVAAALAEYLAARLRSPRAAVVTPELAKLLQGAGLEAALAERAALAVRDLTASRYGGGAVGIDTGALVAELEAGFRRSEARR